MKQGDLTDREIQWLLGDPEFAPKPTEEIEAEKKSTSQAIDEAVFGSREYLERDIIGALLVNGSVVESDGLSSELFTGRYGIIYDAMKGLTGRCGGYDFATVYSELGPVKIKSIGGMEFFNKLTSDCGIVSAIPHNIKALKRFARRDQMSNIAKELAVGVGHDDEIALKTIAKLQDIGTDTEDISPASDLVSEALEVMLTPGEKGFTTGISKLDTSVGGISNCFSVIAGKPGMGKSSFLLSLAVNMALAGKRVHVWSGEDSKSQMMQRIITRFAEGDMADQLVHAATKAKSLPITFWDKSGISCQDLSDKCQEIKKQSGLDVVICDHLGKLREKGDNLYQKTSAVSGGLADMQLRLGVPVIAGCQLRRGQPGDSNIPGLEALRDSGWIEADARMVVILHRPHYMFQCGQIDEEPDKNEIWLNVAKNNHGQTMVLKLYCDMSQFYIGDPPTQERSGWADEY